jgi:hypothetical protein
VILRSRGGESALLQKGFDHFAAKVKK